MSPVMTNGDGVEIRRGDRVPESPSVSVVIPAYFGGRPDSREKPYLEEALASVRAQTFRDYEIILVDDGSPLRVEPADASDVVLVRHPNAGPGGARNRGVSIARGEWVALLDADDRWHPEKLARQMVLHERQPSYVLSCTDFLRFRDDGRTVSTPRLRERGDVDGDRVRVEKLFYENCVCCSTVVVRRDVLARTPGMVPHRRLGEDYGLWMRIALLGPIGHVDEVLLDRRVHPGNIMNETLHNNAWILEERRIYEEVLRDHPSTAPLIRHALARIEWQIGYDHLERRQWSQARASFVRAVLKAPPGRRTFWTGLARSVLRLQPRLPG
jgi:glycosyltransferase involved in cell wall biosynthesis